MSSPGTGDPPEHEPGPTPGAAASGGEAAGSEASGTQASGTRTASPGSDVSSTLRDMWRTRPSRRRDDRVVAGVAAAIARRYAIDPTLVRVAFVVTAFYGVGLLLYLAGWLMLPRADRPQERERSVKAVIGGVLVVLVAAGPLFGGRPGGLIGVLVVVTLLYALHHSRAALGHRDDDPSAGQPGHADPVEGAGPHDTVTASAMPAPGASATVAPPGPPPPPPRPRSPLVPATLGAALLAGALVLVLGLVRVLPLGVTPVVATMLAVVGVGLVIGAFLQRGRGLLLVAVPLALVLVGAAGADRFGHGSGPPWGHHGGGPETSRGVADGSWTPTSAAAVAPIYQSGTGSSMLDLRGIPAGQPPVSTTVRSGTGTVTVLVPTTADVTADCESGTGDVDCLGRGAGRIVDPGPDGPGGPVLDVRAMTGTGNVEVRRG